VQDWMGQVGERVGSPLTLLREYTDALRRILAGENVTTAGRYVSLNDVQLAWPPATPVPLMLGGGGPKSLALTGEIGDGSLLSAALSDDEVAEACSLILSAVAERGDDTDGYPIVATTIAATGDGAQGRVDTEVPRWGKPAGVGIGVAGSAEDIAASVRRIAAFGITSVAIQVTEDEPDLFGFIEFLGREVKPLLAE
jgi:5,10-methylenetetrahydromethanopterin reductase